MNLFGSSRTSNTTNLSVDNSTDVLDQSGNSGAIGRGNTVITSDQGAITAAGQIAQSALSGAFGTFGALNDSMRSLSDRAFWSADNFADLTRDSYSDSLGFADRTQSRAMSSIDTVARTLEVSADAQRRSVADAYATAQDSATGNRTLMFVALAVVGAIGIAAFMSRQG
jgi:hypothetical protein